MSDCIHVKSYIVQYKSLDNCQLPKAHGSMIRGALGNVLRKWLCSEEDLTVCENCNKNKVCIYTQLFFGINKDVGDSPLSTFLLPNPYVINPLNQGVVNFKKDDSFRFELILIGNKTHQYAPYYLSALKEMGVQGLGIMRGKFNLTGIYDKTNQTKIDLNNLFSALSTKSKLINMNDSIDLMSQYHVQIDDIKQCEIIFKTPLRLMKNGKLTSEFSYEDLIKAILRRVTLLSQHYELTSSEQMNIDEILEEAAKIQIIDKNIQWQQLERSSTYKMKNLSIGGIMGSIIVEGVFNKTLVLLELAKWIHLGKACTTGDGWIEFKFRL